MQNDTNRRTGRRTLLVRSLFAAGVVAAIAIPVGRAALADGTSTDGGPRADAGDAVSAVLGEEVRLVGAAPEGQAPLRFAWSIDDGPAATFASPATASTMVRTAILRPGTHRVVLTVTDALDRQATDVTTVTVRDVVTTVLVDQPVGVGRVPFTVPAGAVGLRATAPADGPARTLTLLGPGGARVLGQLVDGQVVASSEAVKPGRWTAVTTGAVGRLRVEVLAPTP